MNAAKYFLTVATAVSLAIPLLAEPPSLPSLGRYNALWSDSPFTIKPIVIETMTDPFEDYALGGVTPLAGGAYLVTLLNKKKPEERIAIPGNTLGLKLVEVHAGTKGPLSTAVMITNGIKSGLVTFDDKLLVLKAPVVAKQQPVQANPIYAGGNQANGGIQPPIQPNLNGQVPVVPQPPTQPNANGQNLGGNRPPRPRTVPIIPTR